MKTPTPWVRALMATAVLLALAFANTAMLRAHWDLSNIGTSRRYWEDMTVAFSLYETRAWGPTPAQAIGGATASKINDRLQELVPMAAARANVRPWEFWRTVEFRGFREIAPFELRFSDDTGRSRLSYLGFRLIGGIAPYLPLWLPFLVFVPLALWIMIESIRCGEGIAFGLFLVLAASSAYLLEALTLPYSAAGFHLLAALMVVPLSLYAFGPAPTPAGLWTRTVLAAVALQVATLCRSSSAIFLPPIALLLLIALLRVQSGSSIRRRAVSTVLLLAVLTAPKALAPPQAHELWIGMWEGLGDFDREYGHVWSDPAARVALDAEGYVMVQRGPYWNEETEAIFRRLVLRDIAADPVWYGRILLQRVFATVTQERLWPTARNSQGTYRPPQHPAEGVTDVYYNFVRTADIFTFFGRTWEAPLWLFWTACGLLLVLALRRRTPRNKRRLAVTASLGIAALLMPVAVTTASGMETQVFVFVFFLSAAFVGSDAIERFRSRERAEAV